MAKLSTTQRNALPDSAFGLPAERAYPMPDVNHARDAKARASEEYHLGKLSAAQKTQIDTMADAIIAAA
jgi:hypothetical protein